MTLTVAGFDVASGITEGDWAIVATNIGSRYSVAGVTDFQVTPRTAATLTSNVAAGTAYGCGVRVTSDAQITVSHATAPSTGTRWDAVVLRRNWSGAGGSASVVVITGTSVRGVPARNNTPGTLDDQVLALVPIIAGQSIPGTPIPMRWWPSKVITCYDLLAITDPVVGMEAVVLGVGTAQDVRWRYQLDATGNPAWEQDTTSSALRTITPILQGALIVTESGWSGGSLLNEGVIDGNHVQVDIEVRRTGARIVANSDGGISDILMGTIVNPDYCPTNKEVVFSFKYFGGSVAGTFGTAMGLATLYPNGAIFLHQLSPNIAINQRVSTDLAASFRAHLTFIRKS